MKRNLIKTMLVLTLGFSALNAMADDKTSIEIERAISQLPASPATQPTERYTAVRKLLDQKLDQLSQTSDKAQFDQLLQQSRDLAQQAKLYSNDLLVDMGDSSDNRRLEDDVFYKQYRLSRVIKSLDQIEQASQNNQFAQAQQLAKTLC
ncbi:hypothetical protein EV694_2069 [Volucribacter psittacicida]|uniref:Soluble cytochrome b562 n=1 Tax=Volucribacter psittacicida TaxID=203482 RepID=A0A4V2PAT4_9PAST|nr:hypothetical protein [Volucribacter psittacicida]TCJ94835.1 hypothetical protein EV694_2069 [Volucribacter psittacicida]